MTTTTTPATHQRRRPSTGAVMASLLLVTGCAVRDRIVDDDPRYHAFYAPGDEYVVTRPVQLSRGDRARHLRANTDRPIWPPHHSMVKGYLDPGARVRVRHVWASPIAGTEMQRITPLLEPVPHNPFGRLIVPTYTLPGFYGVAGVATDVAAPDPDYFRKVEPEP